MLDHLISLPCFPYLKIPELLWSEPKDTAVVGLRSTSHCHVGGHVRDLPTHGVVVGGHDEGGQVPAL